MKEFIAKLKAKYNSYESKFNCNYPDNIDCTIKQDLKRNELLKIVQTFKPLNFENIFPINELAENRFTHLDSGSFGNAFLLEKGRHRRPVIVKYIRCIPGNIYQNFTKHISAMNYNDVFNEIRCMQILNKLNNGVRYKVSTGVTNSEGKRSSHRYSFSKVNCFPVLFEAYLCDSSRSLVTLEPYYQFQSEYLYYPGFESVIVVMEHCGTLLLNLIKNNSISVAGLVSMVKQLILGLFVAECVFSYEHRDAHLGNILAKETSEKYIKFVYNSKAYSVPSYGYQLKIIDFTYSRICLNEISYFKDLSFMYDTIRDDDNDDVDDNYSFDGYTEMRKYLRNDWDRYSPKTNLAWVNHIMKSILGLVKKSLKESQCENGNTNDEAESDEEVEKETEETTKKEELVSQQDNNNIAAAQLMEKEKKKKEKEKEREKIRDVLPAMLQCGGGGGGGNDQNCGHAYYRYLKLLLSISVKCNSLDELVRLICSEKFNTIVRIKF